MKAVSFQDVREILKGFPKKDRTTFLEMAIRKAERRVKRMESSMCDIVQRIKREPTETHPLYMAAVETFMVPELSERIGHHDFLLRLKATFKGNGHQTRFSDQIDRARKTNIVEVAETLGLEVRRRGRNFVALCPFHVEKTPSFTLYPDRNRFYCYGCQASGSVIDLYMALTEKGFKETVKELAL